jgi:hypothetical protein
VDLFSCQQRPWEAFVQALGDVPPPLPLVGGSLISASVVSTSSVGAVDEVPVPLPLVGGSEG